MLGQKLMGPETRRRDSNNQGFELYGIKAFKYRVYANCLWRCFRKEESSSQPPALQRDALWGKPSCFKPPSPGRGQACVRARSVLSHPDSLTGSSWCLYTNICKCAIFWEWLTISQLLLIGKTNLWCVVDLRMVFQYNIPINFQQLQPLKLSSLGKQSPKHLP